MRLTLNSTVVAGAPTTVASPDATNSLLVRVVNDSGFGGVIYASGDGGTSVVEVADGYSSSILVAGGGSLTLWTNGIKIRRNPGKPTGGEYLYRIEINWGAATA